VSGLHQASFLFARFPGNGAADFFKGACGLKTVRAFAASKDIELTRLLTQVKASVILQGNQCPR
jgi:hypothetical protein